jgi:opacity protein-like surface antigen
MRVALLAIAMLGVASGAHAADLPDLPVLRGSFTPTTSWDGWYAGGTAAYNSSVQNFSGSLTGLTNSIYRDTTLEGPTSSLTALGKATTQGTGFGAFVGRNWQWTDVVLGIEANYNYMSKLSAYSSSSLGPLLFTNPPGENPPAGTSDTYSVKLVGSAVATLQDMITFRGRAGYVWGDIMPYMFGGLAVGRMDVERSVTTTTTKRVDTITTDAFGNVTTILGTPQTVPALTTTLSQGRTNNFVVGWTGGLGFEFRIWEGLFARAEYEHVGFTSVENVIVSVDTVRAGLGYKF